MSEAPVIDLSQIPLAALKDKTRYLLEVALNKQKVIPTDEGNLPRDWRGIAHLTGINTFSISQSSNPLSDILKEWDKEKLSKQESRPSIKDLQDILGHIDRWDIYDDTADLMVKDAEDYISRSLQVKLPEKNSEIHESECLTTDDLERYHQGLPLDKYDAFLLYADEEEDRNFASVMVDKLENEYCLRLCVKDRDLIGGVGFEFKAITKLIAERCSSLIVILSPNFLKSEANMFFLTFAQALSIEQQKRKIIPCSYVPCKLPPEISYLYFLDYKRSELFGNFWKRLKDSVLASSGALQARPNHTLPGLQEPERCIITEVHSEEISVADEPKATQETAMVRMSDPSTHFPGNTMNDSLLNDWVPSKQQQVTDSVASSVPTKSKGPGSFLSRLLPQTSTVKNPQKKKWFKKKKAVALSA